MKSDRQPPRKPYRRPTEKDWGPPADTEHARVAFRLIHRIMAGGLKGAKRLEAFRYMNERFPGVGWDEAIDETEKAMGM